MLGKGGGTPPLNKDRQWNRFSRPAGPLAARLEQQQTSSLISVTDVCGHLQSKQTKAASSTAAEVEEHPGVHGGGAADPREGGGMLMAAAAGPPPGGRS